MRKILRPLFFICGSIALLTLAGCKEQFLGMLNPKGIIAFQERKLFFDTLALMLIVVLPVIIMSFAFVFHYQVSHRIRDYKPHWGHSYFLETLWWSIPCVIIIVLATITWKKTHELDPYQTIAGQTEPPMIIQVIALPWKWLFIYPEQNIATVNYLEIPVDRQVEYWLTTDNVPMSAFFVPQLGSQIYTMTGMRTRLHLIANEVGTYVGMNTMFNGDGFSDMHFTVHVEQPKEVQQWFQKIKGTSQHLTETAYQDLLKASIGDQPKFFSGVTPDLFHHVIMTYMTRVGPTHPRADLSVPHASHKE